MLENPIYYVGKRQGSLQMLIEMESIIADPKANQVFVDWAKKNSQKLGGYFVGVNN